MTTRIGVNLLFCVPGVVGGSEDYAVRTLAAFAEHGPEDLELTLFAPPALLRAHPELGLRFRVVRSPVSGRVKPVRVLAESTWLAAQVRRRRLALVHHLGGRIPALRAAPAMVTIHDLQPLHTPARFHPVKRSFLAWSLPRSVGSAVHVVTVSDTVAADVAERLHVPPERITTVSSAFTPRLPVADPPATVRRRLEEGRRLLVYPAITHHHKGHVPLLDAFARIATAHAEVDLVLTGGTGGAEEEVAARAAPLGDRVLRLGRIGRPELDATIAAAEALVFPSLFEGFGLPVLEALAFGVPVICSDIPALAEVAGGAARLVRPGDVAGWAAAIEDRLLDRPRRDEAAAAGRARADHYRPERTAAALTAAYRLALEASG